MPFFVYSLCKRIPQTVSSILLMRYIDICAFVTSTTKSIIIICMMVGLKLCHLAKLLLLSANGSNPNIGDDSAAQMAPHAFYS